MATDAASVQTPSPPRRIHTPPAPRLGFHDSYEPYSPRSPRKSARISSQRTVNRTPSPSSSRRKHTSSPRAATKANSQTDLALASPTRSPQKKRQPPPASSRRVSGALTAESIASASAAIGFSNKPTTSMDDASITRASGMLPTPSKTPRKAPNEKTVASIQSFARNLFPSEEEALSTPRKKRAKKYSGMTMESFAMADDEDSIEIFTDSQDRIPVKDESSSNPFYGDISTEAEPSKRRSKRRQVVIPGEGAQSIDEASRREDGMVYVFRGKKFFRKFAESSNAESEEQGEANADFDAELARPLTRSTVKPRLLFQTEKTAEMLEDEEAATDVEDGHMESEDLTPQTPVKTKQISAKTPEAPKFAPMSPPDTKRTTRSANKLDQGTPMKKSARRVSLFDSWPRTKEHKDSSATKRQGEDLASTNTKRSRA